MFYYIIFNLTFVSSTFQVLVLVNNNSFPVWISTVLLLLPILKHVSPASSKPSKTQHERHHKSSHFSLALLRWYIGCYLFCSNLPSQSHCSFTHVLWQTCSSLLLPWWSDIWHSPCSNKHPCQNAWPKIDLMYFMWLVGGQLHSCSWIHLGSEMVWLLFMSREWT